MIQVLQDVHHLADDKVPGTLPSGAKMGIGG